jgi:hypothetical protein
MQVKKSVPEPDAAAEWQRRLEEERQKLVVQKVKLPNGAVFTRLKPVTVG